ncbi:MAG: cytochrome [Frankiales bacterium]|nr:cytochrome [Frankiales bacterium]
MTTAPVQPSYAPRSDKPVDPWPVIAADRAQCPVAHNADLGAIAVLRYEDIKEAVKDPSTFVNRYHTARVMDVELPVDAQVLAFADAPRHGRQRRLLSAALSAARVEERKQRIQEIADEMVDGLLAGGPTFELVEQFARPFPGAVLAEVLGVPPEDRASFVRGAQLSEAGASFARREDIPWLDQLDAWQDYIRVLVKGKREAGEGTGDLISALCFADVQGDRFTDEEVAQMVKLLLQAGNTTTTSLLGNAVVALDAFPEQKALFLSDPAGRVKGVVEETLRYDGPLHGLYRKAVEDAELGGCPVRAGESVWLGFGAGSHDPEVFSDPERYDITRSFATPHLGFGQGMHFCAGSNLARAEALVALETLYRRLPGLRVREGFVPQQLQAAVFRSWQSIEMVYDAP